ncbi:MAG: hypothetical protein IKT73_08005, partial [Anaerotignum sp.]|nr:hypothetical protein [Anaerotignum sp.]
MGKDGWKGLFRPENKKVRSNMMIALLLGVLLLAAGRTFSEEKEENVSADTMEKAVVTVERETEKRMAEI